MNFRLNLLTTFYNMMCSERGDIQWFEWKEWVGNCSIFISTRSFITKQDSFNYQVFVLIIINLVDSVWFAGRMNEKKINREHVLFIIQYSLAIYALLWKAARWVVITFVCSVPWMNNHQLIASDCTMPLRSFIGFT